MTAPDISSLLDTLKFDDTLSASDALAKANEVAAAVVERLGDPSITPDDVQRLAESAEKAFDLAARNENFDGAPSQALKLLANYWRLRARSAQISDHLNMERDLFMFQVEMPPGAPGREFGVTKRAPSAASDIQADRTLSPSKNKRVRAPSASGRVVPMPAVATGTKHAPRRRAQRSGVGRPPRKHVKLQLNSPVNAGGDT
jgi:hypothetical protein